MKTINLLITVTFLVTLSACALKTNSHGINTTDGATGTDQTTNAGQNTGVTQQDQTGQDVSDKTTYDLCIEKCAPACEKQGLDSCEDACNKVCSIFQTDSGSVITCNEPSVKETCQIKDLAAYIAAKEALTAKCEALLTAAEKDLCYKDGIAWLQAQDFAQNVCTSEEVAGQCFITSTPVCETVIKEQTVCGVVDKQACDDAYSKLPAYIEAQCGSKPATPDPVYEKCYADAKAALIIPVCTPQCVTTEVPTQECTGGNTPFMAFKLTCNKGKFDQEQISAFSVDEAIKTFLDSFQEEPVCK